MRETYAAMSTAANSGGAKTGIDFSVLGIGKNVNDAISAILKFKEPRKTWGFLCDLLWKTSRFEMTERVAKHRMAGTRDYTGEEIRALLQSDDGAGILEALMADAKPRWWAGVETAMKIATARRYQEMARQAVLSLDSAPLEMPTRRKIKRTVDADRTLSGTVAAQEATLGLFLANSDSVASRTVAQTQGEAQAGRGGRR